MKIAHAGYSGPLVGLATIVLIVSSLLALSSARGELLFSDSFDYPAGNLDGQGPPPGSPPGQGGWIKITHEPQVVPSGLDFPGILTAGNSAALRSIPDMVSDEAYAAIGPVTPDIGIVWIGFLTRKDRQRLPHGGFAVVAAIGASILDPSVGIGMIFEKNRYGLDNDTGERGSRSVTSVPVDRSTVWLVTKLDFTTGNEYLWVNPSPETEPDIANADAWLPMTAAFQSAGFPYLRLRVGYTHAIFQFDELRVGTTFADVVNSEAGQITSKN
jgi:hypothetical protein